MLARWQGAKAAWVVEGYVKIDPTVTTYEAEDDGTFSATTGEQVRIFYRAHASQSDTWRQAEVGATHRPLRQVPEVRCTFEHDPSIPNPLLILPRNQVVEQNTGGMLPEIDTPGSFRIIARCRDSHIRFSNGDLSFCDSRR